MDIAASRPDIDALLERALKDVTLDDKYTLQSGRAYMSGTQALVRLPMLQHERDRRAGLNTAGFISGYRGSPLGGVDQTLWKARKHLAAHQIVFQPGLNEELAANSLWGTQQLALTPRSRVDGVFGMWYGKGPGVDRCSDVFKHANAAGSSPHGGVLVLAGDDHGAKSSTLPHQSDHIFKACGLPLFYPSNVQEAIDYGLHGWAMSRWSGLWVAMKTVTEVIEASASVTIDPDRVKILLPEDFAMPADGLNIRWPDTPPAQEARLIDYKWYASLAYVRANKLNHTVIDSPNPWFGIVTAGKSYVDTRQALDDLGLDEATCSRIGIRLFKVGVIWPLEAQSVREFATGLEEILVVEEKRQILEYALKEELYNWRDDVRPRVYGKFDERDGQGGEWAMPRGRWLLPAHMELSPSVIAKAIAARLLNPGKFGSRFEMPSDLRARIEARLAIIDAKEKALAATTSPAVRVPTFCSGCPHNTSTHVPEGSRAVAGIGCHWMAVLMPERRTQTFSQMGGEGAAWIGQAPFSDEKHIFANLGDGTYFHSGVLAIRAAIASKVNITYKILYNDAVAMTGGQPHDGTLTVPQIVAQMKGEGAAKVVVVTDEPEKYQTASRNAPAPLPADVEVHHRDHLDFVQKQLREIEGCTVLVYDQTCASEKRRRRKRIVDGVPGFPDPARRVVINEAVCEGCGDCNVQSSCMSVEPVDTDLGRKRRINQSTCNKDYSCIKGFCPSFVTVEGGRLRKGSAKNAEVAPDGSPVRGNHAEGLPEPQRVSIHDSGNRSYGILVTGVGGTGVVTIGQWIGMAAHLENRGVSVLDMAGLAQKGGAVFSHVQIAEHPEHLFSTRVATGEAELMIGSDLVVSAGVEALARMRPGVTRAVINADVAPTSDFLRNPDWSLPVDQLKHNILEAAGDQEMDFIEANAWAVALLGDAIYTNPLLLGYAWQKGWLPLTRQSLERAIELNDVQVVLNLKAFDLGRKAAHDLDAVRRLVRPAQVVEFRRRDVATSSTRGDEAELDALIERRMAMLKAYQSRGYAKRYRKLVDRVRTVEGDRIGSDGKWRVTEAVARYYAKLMAYKDEYEVARLHRDPAFREQIASMFEGDYELKFHLAPPSRAKVDPKTGKPAKIAYGGWIQPAFAWLSAVRFVRGTFLDPFARTEERRTERELIREYELTINEILARLDPQNHPTAVELASIPEHIRGYGHVKARHLTEAKQRQAALLVKFRGEPQKATVTDIRAA